MTTVSQPRCDGRVIEAANKWATEIIFRDIRKVLKLKSKNRLWTIIIVHRTKRKPDSIHSVAPMISDSYNDIVTNLQVEHVLVLLVISLYASGDEITSSQSKRNDSRQGKP